MTITKNSEGAWVISAFTLGGNSYLVTRMYYFHTKKEAITKFKQEFRGLVAQNWSLAPNLVQGLGSKASQCQTQN